MAIQTLSFISLILRPYVEQPISTDGWKSLFAQVDPHRNFDGELMAFGTMSGQDMDTIIERLISFGYVGPNEGEKSDMIVSDMFAGTDNLPSWIELVDVSFFDEDQAPAKAWKMKNSGVYDLINFEANLRLPRKGYQCDWPPLIGKIGS
ncbi:MAG: hypothetical protein P8L68_05955 [Paracoccaceae bacterium]|nr:hypothetical protein [Paracoccaceae bacterium]MDG2258020.1 hypothetical protein [Paracoccaceae bacterium]